MREVGNEGIREGLSPRSFVPAEFELGVSQYQIAYVTNAINELVAYPEADLPE